MPPFLPRKRLAATPPPTSPRRTPTKKPRLADALDGPSTQLPSLPKRFTLDYDSDSDSSLSDVDSDEFENVETMPTKNVQERTDPEDDEDEDVDWEDATKDVDAEPVHVPMAGGDLQLTFRKDDEGPDYAEQAAASGKKGPTKKERATRILTHTMHVQCLMFHNAIRNSWICDKKLQAILVDQLPTQIKEEVHKWKIKSGLVVPKARQTKSPKSAQSKKRTDKRDRNERDWGNSTERLEAGKPDLGSGDPLVHLMKVLAAYWKKRFAITAPGLRKRGYGTKLNLKRTIASYRNEEHNPELHGERITNLEEFRKLAIGSGRNICGSRDVGAQLFTALCRGLGIESRMVTSLQPSGFGWSKAEQITIKKVGKVDFEDESDGSDEETPTPAEKSKQQSKGKSNAGLHAGPRKSRTKLAKSPAKAPARKVQGDGHKSAPIDLEAEEDEEDAEDSDSIVDITPLMPTPQPQLYDRDLPFPIYWTEVISPIDHTVLPVSPLVIDKNHYVAATPDQLSHFEPRGGKAEKAKQVMAYVVAHSDDGTAKDVTTRYLKRRTWPGKTKGMRIPVEKIPVYDKRGKIIRHEEYDWFKEIMRGYVRTEDKLTDVDNVEDTTDLVPQQPQKKAKEDEGDTLSSLKTSAEWVLERHLRREEALLPGAEADRVFVSGKPNTASYKEEEVFRRADVVKCQTAETWHKFGRIPIAGEAPLKHVPVRAVTLTRKREVEDHLKQTGEKLMQGLYSETQTEYIIPPPIKDGKIPKNSYNNIDCFVESMVPKGAVHLKMKGLKRICNKLEIDFAEAVVGFEFGNKIAVPVIQGVVIAEEHKNAVKDAWKVWAEEQRIKEEGKIEKQALDMWRKMLMGLRIRERVADEYGTFEIGNEISNASKGERGATAEDAINVDEDNNPAAGGFDLEDEEDMTGGGFIVPHEDDEDNELIMDEHTHEPDRASKGKGKDKSEAHYPTPSSIPSDIQQKDNTKRRSLIQHDSADESDITDSALSDLTSSSEEDDSDEYEAPKRSPIGKPTKATRPASVDESMRNRTRRSLRAKVSGKGEGETSPYF